jgi:hypothetical protein
MSYVRASQEMPYLSNREVEAMARQYGFVDRDEEEKVGERMQEPGSGLPSEKPTRSNSEGSLQMRELEGGIKND